MPSVFEVQQSANDFVEITAPVYPIIVADAFTGRNPTVTVSDAVTIIGPCTSITFKTAADVNRTRTLALANPHLSNFKYTQIVDAVGATGFILWA